MQEPREMEHQQHDYELSPTTYQPSMPRERLPLGTPTVLNLDQSHVSARVYEPVSAFLKECCFLHQFVI
jgi:hypothetical protein